MSDELRILITGSRDWNDEDAILRALNAVVRDSGVMSYEDVTVIHGACPTGADYIADQLAEELGCRTERHPADWKRYGKSAGFRRNSLMVSLGADVCLAFILNDSRGATMTARLANTAGIPVQLDSRKEQTND